MDKDTYDSLSKSAKIEIDMYDRAQNGWGHFLILEDRRENTAYNETPTKGNEMERKRVKLVVEVDLDPVPGAFHTKEDASFRIQQILMNSIPHYDPTTDLLEE